MVADAVAVEMNNPEKVIVVVAGIDREYPESHTVAFVFHYTFVACNQHFVAALVIGCRNDFEEATYDYSTVVVVVAAAYVAEYLLVVVAFAADGKPLV